MTAVLRLVGFGQPSLHSCILFLKKHLAGKRFVTDADVKLAVTYWLYTVPSHCRVVWFCSVSLSK
jgi:hypothetical protein